MIFMCLGLLREGERIALSVAAAAHWQVIDECIVGPGKILQEWGAKMGSMCQVSETGLSLVAGRTKVPEVLLLAEGKGRRQ